MLNGRGGARGVIVLIAWLLVASPSGAAAQLPSPARDAAEELVEVVRTGDRARIREFIEARFTERFIESAPMMEYHVPVFASLGRQVAGLTNGGVNLRGPTEAMLLLEGPGRRMQVVVRVEAEPPHRIGYLGWGDPGPDIKGSTLEDLGPELERLAGTPPFSGVVLVASEGEIRLHEAHGTADLGTGREVRPDTRFDIGSLNKLFTSTAILRLVEDGRLGLDDPLGRYVAGFPTDVAERVTIRHLLQHRSGFGDYLTHPRFEADPKRFRRVEDFLPLAREQALAFEPGTRQAYSNMGFVLLGAAIEGATGRDYHQVVEELVFRPAGMTTAGPTGGPQAAGRYEIQHGRFVALDGAYPDHGTPAGGGFASAPDLFRFVEAILGGELLNEENTALLLNRFERPSAPAALPADFRFAGGAPGVGAIIEARVADRRTIIVLSNMGPFAAGAFARRIEELAG